MNKIILLIPAIALAGCAEDAKFMTQQNALYQTSIAQYQDYNCTQVKAEMLRVSGLIDRQTELLQPSQENKNQYLETAVSVFAIARGINPNNNNSDTSEERTVLARFKSQYNGLDQLFIRKNCVNKNAE